MKVVLIIIDMMIHTIIVLIATSKVNMNMKAS